MDNILEITGLTKSYDGQYEALSDCSFTLGKGKICAVVGESGSGKSTLIRLIAGLERPNVGQIKINGQVMTDDRKMVPPQDRSLGLVFQDFALFPHLTVGQNITFGLKDKTQSVIDHWLDLIDMKGYQDTYPSMLSGGQEQRVSIARTLATQPELLLLDEPFSNLDAVLKSDLRKEIQQLVKKLGITMVFITHDLVDALDIADEIMLLSKGKMLVHSPLVEFAQSIQHPEAQSLIDHLKLNARQILEVLGD